MPALLKFPLSSGETINLALEISKHYSFSIELLQDNNGNTLNRISEGVGPRPERILQEVFRKWLAGSGKPLKTWKTIIQVLKDIKMLTLAETLETQLTE